jgi:hypothetical protein
MDQTMESQHPEKAVARLPSQPTVLAQALHQGEADNGLQGSQPAEQPEFEDSHGAIGAGKRGVRTFHCAIPPPPHKFNAFDENGLLVGQASAFQLSRLHSLNPYQPPNDTYRGLATTKCGLIPGWRAAELE